MEPGGRKMAQSSPMPRISRERAGMFTRRLSQSVMSRSLCTWVRGPTLTGPAGWMFSS